MFKIIWKTSISGLNANIMSARTEKAAIAKLKSFLHADIANDFILVRIAAA